MITADQLADIIRRSPKGTALIQISRIPGKERYRGLCPFHHEKTGSFDVFVGADHGGHYYCHGCHEHGTASWWLHKMEGQVGNAICKPDPVILIEHERRGFAEGEWRALRDRDPELPEEARFFLEPDLRESLRRRLGS